MENYTFDKAKPFWPIVITYLTQLHGMKQLCVVGTLAKGGITRSLNIPPHLKSMKEELESGMTYISSPLSLEIRGENERLVVSVEETAAEIVSALDDHLYFQIQAAHFCLVMAHERTKDEPYHNCGEKWEFLRHCRHAVAHNGKWHFTGQEPKRPAKWRGIELENKMHGYPLFLRTDGMAYLKLGDPIALLWDIEQEIP
jgi:hypothetical protein